MKQLPRILSLCLLMLIGLGIIQGCAGPATVSTNPSERFNPAMNAAGRALIERHRQQRGDE